MTFTNKRYFNRQELEILSSSLMIRRKTLFESFQFEIPFDHISNRKKVNNTINNNSFFIGISFFVLGLLFMLGTLAEISPLLILIGVFFILITFIFRKRTVSITCYDGNTIELNYNESDKMQVIDYADQIIKSANEYLLRKYGRIDRDRPIEKQLENLDFLLDREIITIDQFESLKNELLGKINKTKIGFSE